MSISAETTHSRPPAAATPRPAGGSLSAPAGLGPLIKQAWYVIAASANVGHELSSITVLNEALVFFRAEDGTPVVLDDRCAHRRYSLAKGTSRTTRSSARTTASRSIAAGPACSPPACRGASTSGSEVPGRGPRPVVVGVDGRGRRRPRRHPAA